MGVINRAPTAAFAKKVRLGEARALLLGTRSYLASLLGARALLVISRHQRDRQPFGRSLKNDDPDTSGLHQIANTGETLHEGTWEKANN